MIGDTYVVVGKYCKNASFHLRGVFVIAKHLCSAHIGRKPFDKLRKRGVVSKDAHPHGPLEGHDHTGRGSDFYCPRVFGVACESCTCSPNAPCPEAYDKTIEIEWVRRDRPSE